MMTQAQKNAVKKYYMSHKEEIGEYNKQYYQENIEEIKKRRKELRSIPENAERNRQKAREYYQKNKERLRLERLKKKEEENGKSINSEEE